MPRTPATKSRKRKASCIVALAASSERRSDSSFRVNTLKVTSDPLLQDHYQNRTPLCIGQDYFKIDSKRQKTSPAPPEIYSYGHLPFELGVLLEEVNRHQQTRLPLHCVQCEGKYGKLISLWKKGSREIGTPLDFEVKFKVLCKHQRVPLQVRLFVHDSSGTEHLEGIVVLDSFHSTTMNVELTPTLSSLVTSPLSSPPLSSFSSSPEPIPSAGGLEDDADSLLPQPGPIGYGCSHAYNQQATTSTFVNPLSYGRGPHVEGDTQDYRPVEDEDDPTASLPVADLISFDDDLLSLLLTEE